MKQLNAKDPKASRSKLKTESNPATKVNPILDLTPLIAKRAYEIYLERGRVDGRADQDWEQAEREIRNDKSLK